MKKSNVFVVVFKILITLQNWQNRVVALDFMLTCFCVCVCVCTHACVCVCVCVCMCKCVCPDYEKLIFQNNHNEQSLPHTDTNKHTHTHTHTLCSHVQFIQPVQTSPSLLSFSSLFLSWVIALLHCHNACPLKCFHPHHCRSPSLGVWAPALVTLSLLSSLYPSSLSSSCVWQYPCLQQILLGLRMLWRRNRQGCAFWCCCRLGAERSPVLLFFSLSSGSRTWKSHGPLGLHLPVNGENEIIKKKDILKWSKTQSLPHTHTNTVITRTHTHTRMEVTWSSWSSSACQWGKWIKL